MACDASSCRSTCLRRRRLCCTACSVPVARMQLQKWSKTWHVKMLLCKHACTCMRSSTCTSMHFETFAPAAHDMQSICTVAHAGFKGPPTHPAGSASFYCHRRLRQMNSYATGGAWLWDFYKVGSARPALIRTLRRWPSRLACERYGV